LRADVFAARPFPVLNAEGRWLVPSSPGARKPLDGRRSVTGAFDVPVRQRGSTERLP